MEPLCEAAALLTGWGWWWVWVQGWGCGWGWVWAPRWQLQVLLRLVVALVGKQLQVLLRLVVALVGKLAGKNCFGPQVAGGPCQWTIRHPSVQTMVELTMVLCGQELVLSWRELGM